MAVQLNHVIFRAKDKWASARFLAGILGIEAGPEWGRFVPVRVANGVTLDFADTAEPNPARLDHGFNCRVEPAHQRFNPCAMHCDCGAQICLSQPRGNLRE